VTASTARAAALKVVTRVRERSAYAHETLAGVLESASLSAQDSAFATRLAYGTVACRGTLDEAVARFVDAPSRLEPSVADALAMGAYELLFMRTPVWAAVDEGVTLVRSVRPKAAGLANAVLRRIGERRDAFPWGDPTTDTAALARQHGHPEWLTEVLIAQLGRVAAVRILEADNEPAPLYLAHVPSLGTLDEALELLERDGADPGLCDLAGCIVAGSPAAAVGGRAVREGRVLVCDAAAQFAARCVGARPHMRILDIGAGRGTKTLIMQGLALQAGGPAEVLAVDQHAFKLQVLSSTADRLGVPGIRRLECDATKMSLDDLPFGTADAVLIDAPCSGIGTLRRHPDRRWRMEPAEVPLLAALGARLLDQVSRLVTAGGFVVYSTCTVTRAENDDVIAAFLGGPAGEGFVLDSLEGEVPHSWRRFVRGDGTFQSLPEPAGPDGHFVARMLRR